MKPPAVWLHPISTETRLLFNRDAELADLVRRLEETRAEGDRTGHILVSGARGVGKSIFTRAAMERFEALHPDQVVSVVADARGLGFRPFLKELAHALVAAVRKKAALKALPQVSLWMDHLELLASVTQLREAEMTARSRKYGVDATVGADTILFKLASRFAWEGSQTFQRQDERTVTVTDELLHAAINAALERLAMPDPGWLVVVFLDDLDQLAERGEEVATTFRRVLDVKPCISLVHFRTESLMEDVQREVSEQVELGPLTHQNLMDIVAQRLRLAKSDIVRTQFPEDLASSAWAPVRWLAGRTGNPLTFLRWTHGLLRRHSWPPPEDWRTSESLLQLILAEDPLNGAEPDFVDKLVRHMQAVDGGVCDRGVTSDELEHAGLKLHEIEDAQRLDLLLPKYRFKPAAGFRLKPLLDLLRPPKAEA